MDSKDLTDLTLQEKAQRIRATKTPEELTTIYDEWAKDSGYDEVCSVTYTLLRIQYPQIYTFRNSDSI